MSSNTWPMVALTICAALGGGVVAGVFFAFSTFVMPALARLPPEQGVAAMQAINVEAINRWLMGALFGTGAACLLLAVSSLLGANRPGSRLALSGSLVYLLGAILVTIAFNVPRNDLLATLSPSSSQAPSLWTRYLVEWTRWNHVRAVAACIATLLLVASLGVRRTPDRLDGRTSFRAAAPTP
jgi:uncharacterized membrane protein